MVVESINEAISDTVAFLPRLAAAIIILIIVWILGRWIGKIVSRVLDKAGLDDALRKTIVGKTIEAGGVSLVHYFDLITRWFIYLIGIMASVNVLGIAALSAFVEKVVTYLPSLVAGIAVLVVGFIAADFIGDLIRKTGVTAGVSYIGIFSAAIKIFLYFIIITMALDQMRINTAILHTFATALAWGIAIAIGIGLGIGFGFGIKDKAPELLESITGEGAKQKLKKLDEEITKTKI